MDRLDLRAAHLLRGDEQLRAVFQVPEDGTKAFYFFCVLAFAAGFSERWAQDTLTGGLTGCGRGKADAAAPAAKPPPGAGTTTRAPTAADGAAPLAASLAAAEAELDAS